MGFEPPQRLVRALGETYGQDAAAGWLDRLPELVPDALAQAGLTAERVVAPGGRSSLVVLVPGAALKLAPAAARPDLERDALAHWNGWGTVKLLGEAGEGGLLLERLHPEMSLRSLPEAKALLEAADTIRKLWVTPPAGHGFETVAVRTERQAESMASYRADAEAGELVTAALAARAELVAEGADAGADAEVDAGAAVDAGAGSEAEAEAGSGSGSGETFLLHGAFRQGKVLAGDRSPWLAVGPEPLVGERAYDLARLVRDRVEDLVGASAGASAARRRVNKLADSLEVDRERLRGWTLFRAVESATRARTAGRRTDAELLLEFASWL
ncbi:aminoglycoside phosphotransferase family protein [Streptomyces sp. NPDC046203]|uniref:aminoglycoside phosphotransferase family protein n=1 Tax=Streptomyces sp. NPDC046203 TaxID=3154602 RepID=UPI0033FF153D